MKIMICRNRRWMYNCPVPWYTVVDEMSVDEMSVDDVSYTNLCNPSEWRQFIDSSSQSRKSVLLHNGNNYPTLPMAHYMHLKGDYTSVKMLLSALKYDDYGWEVIEYFKMVSFLMGLQEGFTKFSCFLCLWDSRDTKAHYHRKDWPQWTEFSVGKSNVQREPLIEPHRVHHATAAHQVRPHQAICHCS